MRNSAVRSVGAASVLLLTSMILSCASKQSRHFQNPDPGVGETESLNYEYSNRTLVDDVRAAHFAVNVEVENPSIAKVIFPEIGDIHQLSPVTGLAVVQFTSDEQGKVISWRFIRHAGAGLDVYVEKIISTMIVIPVKHKGESGKSVFNVRFIFTGRK